jgi:hypothetical protein
MTESEERIFSLEEARAELPGLRERLPRLRDARRSLIESSRRIEDALAADGGGVAGSEWFEAQRVLRDELVALAERGILLRDPETGLVDFPAERDGHRVLLCWRLSEDDIGWYHESTGGFASRKPL